MNGYADGRETSFIASLKREASAVEPHSNSSKLRNDIISSEVVNVS
jgi:hypothetical protein